MQTNLNVPPEKKPTFPIRGSFSRGWDLTKQHFGLVVGVLAFSFLVNFFFSAVLNATEDSMPLSLLANLIVLLVSGLLYLGALAIAFKLYDGKPAVFADLFSQPDKVLRYVVASILYGLIVFAGLLLLIVPGIIWAIKFQFFNYFLVDRNLSALESLQASGKLTTGHKWRILLFNLAAGLFNLAGALVFGIGLLVTIPVTMFASVGVYRWLLQRVQPEPVEEKQPAEKKLAENGAPAGVMTEKAEPAEE